MGHHIRGYLGRAEHLEGVLAVWEQARLAHLRDGYRFIPLTDALADEFDAAARAGRVQPVPLASQADWPPLLRPIEAGVAATWSERGAVGYIETDYFGGNGTQSAVCWNKREVVCGPLISTWRRFGPINAVLHELGVTPHPGCTDAFESIGLPYFRDADDFEEPDHDYFDPTYLERCLADSPQPKRAWWLRLFGRG